MSGVLQFIIVTDTIPPILIVPPDITIAYGESTAMANTGQGTATDNCSVKLNFSDNVSAGGEPLATVIIRTWIAEDNCGSHVSQDQLILIEAPIVAPIIQVDSSSTEVTLRSLTTNTWAVQPEYCTDLTAGPTGWTPISDYDNLLQLGTNVTTLLGHPPPNQPYRFFRIRQIPPP